MRERWKSFLSQSKSGVLQVYGVPITTIGKKYGTPLYIVAEQEIRHNFQRAIKAFSDYPKVRLQYPCKVNSNIEVLKIAREEGVDLDASSVGEIILALLADFEPNEITLTNLYKTEQDIFFAAKVGVYAITVDSLEEVEKVNTVGKKLRKKIKILIRVNPYIALGSYSTKLHKYGIPLPYAKRAIDMVMASKYIELQGFHFHGGYINNQKVYFQAARTVVKLASYAKNLGATIQMINLGGGFPRSLMGKKVFQFEDMGRKFTRYFRKLLDKYELGLPTLTFEPGKSILSNSEMGLMKIISRKRLSRNYRVAVTDGSTYGFVPDILIDKNCSYDILPATKMNKRRSYLYEIAGVTCDCWDILGKNRKLPKLYADDLLMIMDIGAYSNTLASNFNNIKRAPMVLVREDGTMKLIRRRDRYSEMFAPELDVLKVADPHELKRYYNLNRVNIDKLWGNMKKKNGKAKNGNTLPPPKST